MEYKSPDKNIGKYKSPADKAMEMINIVLGRNLTDIEIEELRGLLGRRRRGEPMIKSDTPSSKAFKVVTGMLGEDDINQIIKKLKDNLPISESETEPIIKNEETKLEISSSEKITVKDIPIYMTGDLGGFSLFKEQTDKEAEKVLYYNAKDNRQLFDDRGDNSDAEIIIKKETSYNKPIPEEDKKSLFNVLHLYLRAYGPRGRSVTTIGIKIPEGVDPSLFMKKLAQEIYEADVKIGALNFTDLKERGYNEFYKRQDALKNLAQTQFLKYANEQLNSKEKKGG
jgi:hypothetical protein